MSIDLHIAKAIADIAIFLEFRSEERLDPDSSVEALEQLASELQNVDQKGQQELAACFSELSRSYGEPYKEFVEALPEALGLFR